MICVEYKCYLHFRIGLPACLVYGACRLQRISRGCSGKHQCASFSCGPGCAGNKGRLYGLPLHQGVPFPGFHVFHGHPFLAQFLDNLPHIAFLPFRNGCRVEFFISFDKLLLPVFPGSRDLAFPFRGVVRVLRLVSGLEVLPVYFPDLAVQFLHRLSDLLCRGL